ncbi:MAG: metE [Herminiimonas sp.]|nr:metE [Herminiimonas sp.]
MAIEAHILGFPRMGAQRELKFALEKYWKGEIEVGDLESVGRELRARHWASQRALGLDWVAVGDFAFYDQVANHIQLLGCAPHRFQFSPEESQIDCYFTMARGVGKAKRTDCDCGHGHADDMSNPADRAALAMTKWFDTNYHYLVPEFSPETTFSLACERLFDEVAEAQALGHRVKAVLIGPLTFLWLGREKIVKADLEGDAPDFDRLSLLENLLPVYNQILQRLKNLGVEWVQVDEPILGLDLPPQWRGAFERAYWQMNQQGINIMLATYFSPLEENLSAVCKLPVAGLHVDAIRAPHELASIADWLPDHKVLSIGIVDGRNIWRTDLDAALSLITPILQKRKSSVWLATSCSLLHVPLSLAAETDLDPELRSWLAFAEEKVAELQVLKCALASNTPDADAALADSRAAVNNRKSSGRVHNADVGKRLNGISVEDDRRLSPFPARQATQRKRFRLPPFPTTTIGSFPQTDNIRAARAAFKSKKIDADAYDQKMRTEIGFVVAKQEAIGLDVLVHGEAERNDMVEYFGEQLDGFGFTRFGWVQSYGSRCVKPPIIFGDVSRPHPMTVRWASYAQSLTAKPMKGMLTGPITILQWSFVRDDQPRSMTALQIAFAIRDEVADLERAGIGIIQIDEPAIREGLPLRRSQWDTYLQWATRAFRVSASVVSDATQIHTHMCYSEFNDILSQIAAMDADVITIETSRSDMELLQGFGQFRYPNEIGPGVYDIHSPRVPSTSEMTRLLRKAAQVIPPENLWVNPDCGLKTRGWVETEAALANMIAAAELVRAEHSLTAEPTRP